MHMKDASFTVSTENVTAEVSADDTHTKITITIKNASIVHLSGTTSFPSSAVSGRVRDFIFAVSNGYNSLAVRGILELFATRRDYLTCEDGVVTITDMTGATPAVFSVEIGE